MSKSTAQKELEKQYKKELKRIKQFVYRNTKKGYSFSANLIPDEPKKITEASVRRLHKITPDKLYLGASYVDESGEIRKGKRTKHTETISTKKPKSLAQKNAPVQTNYGKYAYKELAKHKKTVETSSKKNKTNVNKAKELQYGTEQLIKDIEERKERQEQERKERAKVNQPYPKENYIKTLVEMYGIDSKQVQEWLKEHPTDEDYYKILKDDFEHKHRLETQEEYREQFKQGTLVYDRIISVINDWRRSGNFDVACDVVEQKINESIELVGKEVAMRNLYEALDMKSEVDEAILYFGTPRGTEALRQILYAIMGRPLTAEEAIHFSTFIANRLPEGAESYNYTGEEFDF